MVFCSTPTFSCYSSNSQKYRFLVWICIETEFFLVWKCNKNDNFWFGNASKKWNFWFGNAWLIFVWTFGNKMYLCSMIL